MNPWPVFSGGVMCHDSHTSENEQMCDNRVLQDGQNWVKQAQ